jgi:hypothetical protein
MTLPNIALCGYSRAGKDSAGKYIASITPLRYTGSLSWAGKGIVAKALGICEMEAWETRHQRRMEWKRILDDYRRSPGEDGVIDHARLIKMSLALGEIVVGIRDGLELKAAKEQGLFAKVFWISMPGNEPDPTVTYTLEDCDLVVYNFKGNIGDMHSTLWHEMRDLGILRQRS